MRQLPRVPMMIVDESRVVLQFVVSIRPDGSGELRIGRPYKQVSPEELLEHLRPLLLSLEDAVETHSTAEFSEVFWSPADAKPEPGKALH